jgi:hypothetical protein
MANKSTEKQWKTRVETPSAPSSAPSSVLSRPLPDNSKGLRALPLWAHPDRGSSVTPKHVCHYPSAQPWEPVACSAWSLVVAICASCCSDMCLRRYAVRKECAIEEICFFIFKRCVRLISPWRCGSGSRLRSVCVYDWNRYSRNCYASVCISLGDV